jgi:hypothetical protein
LISKNNDGKDKLEEKISRLKKYIDNYLRNYFKDISYILPNNNHFIVQFRKNNQEKIYSEKDGSWLTFSGYVFDLNETRQYSANDLWNLYLKYGQELPNKLDGHFIIKIFDARKNKFFVFNDIYKNRTEFLTETNDFIMFSPLLILSAVLRKPELDMFAFNEFMWRYYILSERSILKGTTKLSPATIYTIQNGDISFNRYWHWPRRYTSLKFSDAVDKLCESMKESARLIRLLDQNPLVEFTMGQDSRQIVSAFTNQNLPFISGIYGKDSFYEVINVKNMVKRHHIKNIHIKLSDDYQKNPWPYFRKGVLLGSCEEPGYIIGRILHMKSQYFGSKKLIVNGVHGRYYKDGLWNEIYVSNFYREPARLEINKLLKYRIMNKIYMDDIFSEKFGKIKSQSQEYFKNMIINSLKALEGSPFNMQIDKFDAEHYGNFGNIANSVCDLVLDLVSPLLLRRNLEFALELPVSWKYNLSKIQRAIVYQLDENLSREKTDFGNITMEPKTGISYYKFLLEYWFVQSKKLRDKYKNKLGLPVTTQLQKAWDYLPIYRSMYDHEEVRNLLNYNKMMLSDILDQDHWHNFIDDFENKEDVSIDFYEYLYKILSVESFLKMTTKI